MAKLGKRQYIRDRVRRSGGKVNPHYLASCYGKVRFDSFEDAKAAADKLGEAKAYKCQLCDYYHRGRKVL